MKEFKLTETKIPNLFSSELLMKISQDIPEVEVSKCYDSLFMAMSHYCNFLKSKDTKVSLSVLDVKNNFKMAMVVSYHKNENEDMPGNWSVEMTFDEEDIKDTKKYNCNDTGFNIQLGNTMRDMHGFKYAQAETVPYIVELLITLIHNWLNEEVNEGEEISLELPGYFIAKAAIEGDEKVLSITPSENIKNIAKGDGSLV